MNVSVANLGVDGSVFHPINRVIGCGKIVYSVFSDCEGNDLNFVDFIQAKLMKIDKFCDEHSIQSKIYVE